ncbi:hypothetical protein EKO23_11710 [Nocardioides guangzhouensis]|uniref:Peptidase MA-like domain-containing protein n=1 Tax=Nocardioides guangzhouensis TaxID=2497878 RepID=A0A4Q4ZCF4_9ACTN|nr:hypothetical protein [Nocardioides guangzhouensis]RYP85663.1 hypothetical protein EKO23_11710 [Nocardioides guangzhouensis]
MAGLSLVLVAALAAVWLVQRGGEGDTPTVALSRPRPDLATETLDRLTDAVAEGRTDPSGLVDVDDPATEDWMTGVLGNVGPLRVADFSARYVDDDPSLTATLPRGQWAAAVDMSWRYAGFDRHPAHGEVTMVFTVRDGQAVLVSAGGGERRTPLWLTGPLEVRRDADSLVAAATPGGVAAYARYARNAVRVVHRVLPRWPGRLVVEVPRDAGALDELLAAHPGEYANIAAVTTTVDGSTSDTSPVHVFVNPVVFAGLRPRGAQVVMSHEATHVATEAATSRTPLWLLEGFADYVALRDVPIPLSVSAGQITRQVRRDGAPKQLPGSAEFDTRTTHLGAAYESAWLACRLLAEVGGEGSLVSLYRRVSGGQPLEAPLRAIYGFGTAELTRRWRADLEALG